MSGSRRSLGSAYEDRAAEFLLGLGYTLVTRRYSAWGGELDIVALDGETIVFVEVKARRDGRLPEESITAIKAARWQRAARAYLREVGALDEPYRFDIIAIDDNGLRHYVGVELNVLEQVSQDGGGAVDDELDADDRRE